MSFKPTYKTGGTNPAKSKPSKNDRDMVSGVSSILRKIKDKKNRKEVAGDMVNQFNREGVNYNKEKFLKNSRSYQSGGITEFLTRTIGKSLTPTDLKRPSVKTKERKYINDLSFKPTALPTIYTPNPKDPRIKSYGDSLNRYNREKNIYETETGLSYDNGLLRSRIVNTDGPKYGYTESGQPLYGYKKPVQPVKYADPKIVEKQKKLKDAGLYTGELDGIWGSGSKKAWQEYTEKNTTSTAPKTTLTTTPTNTVQTPKQLPGNTSQMQKYDYMSTEDKKRAVKKYGDPSKIPFQGVNINQLRKEVPTFQGGGTRSPIYVSNPNDPRLRRYNDSMSLYQTTRSMEPMFAANPNDPRLPAYNKKAADIATRSGIKPTTLRTVGGENPYSSDFDPMMMEEPYFAKFKKPVQPVVMDPLAEIKKIKGMGIAKPITDSASTSLPTSVNIPMRIRKQLPTVKHTNNYEDFDIRIHNTPGERYYREVVIPMKKQRARAPAKHTKNYPDTPGRGYKKGGVTTKEQKLSQLYKAFKLKK